MGILAISLLAATVAIIYYIFDDLSLYQRLFFVVIPVIVVANVIYRFVESRRKKDKETQDQ